tara:strand:- start:871 stop:1542 length:672 start_codon:yes stop_codon:yes gene_type:complete
MASKKYTYAYPHPAVTTDIVVFTVREGRLKLLLIERNLTPFKGSWALPGGFVALDEDIDECARRELAEETGVEDIYLEQLRAYGDPDRDPRERVITIAYFALIASDKIQIRADTDAAAVNWFSVDELPKLAFDHAVIVDDAKKRLQGKLNSSAIAFQFLPAEFTLRELQQVHEIIGEEEIDKRNFRKWVLGLDAIKETGKQTSTGAHRPAKLYRLSKSRKPKR